MARRIEYQGRVMEFPDEATDEMIASALEGATSETTKQISTKRTPISQALAPRLTEAMQVPGGPQGVSGAAKVIGGAALDVLSLPGRIIGSAPEAMSTVGDGMEAVSKTGAEPGTGIVQKVLRDPANIPSMAVGGPLGRGGVAVASKVAPNVAKGIGLALGGAGEGAVSAAIHQGEAAQRGDEVSPLVALGEIGVSGLMGGAPSVLRKGLKEHGEKVVMSTMKPSARDIADGFKAQNVYKYGLDGTLEQSSEKADALFKDLSQQLKEKIGSSSEQIDVIDVLSQTLGDVSKNRADFFGKNAGMDKAAQFFIDEIEKVAPDGVVDLATAQQIKRGTGKLGAWQFGSPDPDANAREALADAFYTNMKKAIEDKAPEGVKEINKQLSDIIPIEKAIIRRLPVEQRNAPIGLFDMMSLVGGGGAGLIAGGPAGAAATAGAAMAGQRAIRSPRVGAIGYRASQAAENVPQQITIPLRSVLRTPFRREEER